LDGVCQEVKRIFLIFLTIKKFEFRIEILTDEVFRELKRPITKGKAIDRLVLAS